VKACAACGEQNPVKARFCLACGAPLADAAARLEERKVVTVLFADLVGFTSRSESMDVEDVRGTLVPYHGLLRRELERHGGTVEKFIGDAVMALFGAPVAHEDDAERAVRAALAIQEAMAELRAADLSLDLHVRIGVNTGEALVVLDADPRAGEGMASGDVVNTAARLQTAAPVDGVLVGEVTHGATSRVVEYDEAAPIQAKGKASPVRAWAVKAARSRLGTDVAQAPEAPLIGREVELDVLWAALDRTRASRAPQLVTLVGVPGVGKSRLVWELLQRVEREPHLITWRQGRSLPYGEGVAFWALGEMVKAQAGVLESDSADEASQKLRRAVHDLIESGHDAEWVEGHLRPLLGLGPASAVGADRQVEAFAAWRRFVEALAERGPTVLVFEDLHWADESLLDFVDHLLEWAVDVPLLVLCTARPELTVRRPAWGGGQVNASTVVLAPLSSQQTAQLVGVLLEQAVLPAHAQRALLERAAGNPLYAQEYVRMLIDAGMLVRRDGHWTLDADRELPLPESVRALIAARLDTLGEGEKATLQDASVMGKVVWVGAVAHIGERDRWVVDEQLHRLTRRQFLRRERRSSVDGETEYAFEHALTRDVAYSALVRSERARKHERAAGWIATLDDRGDRAELLAHHYATALEAATATGGATDEMRESARRAILAAAERALMLNSYAAARDRFREALAIWPAGASSAKARFGLGLATFYGDGTTEDLARAAEVLADEGMWEDAVEALLPLVVDAWNAGDAGRADRYAELAASLVAGKPDTPATALVLGLQARRSALLGDPEHGLELALRAADAARATDDIRLQATTRAAVGLVRTTLDDAAGMADLDEAVRIADASDDPRTLSCYSSAAAAYYEFGDIERWMALTETWRSRARRLGHRIELATGELDLVLEGYETGRWDAATAAADALDGDSGVPEMGRAQNALTRAMMALARGEIAVAAVDDTLAFTRSSGNVHMTMPALAVKLRMALDAADRPTLARTLDEALDLWSRRPVFGCWLPVEAAYAAVTLGRSAQFEALASQGGIQTAWVRAARSIARTDFGAAADILSEVPSLAGEAYARRHAAQRMIAQGRPTDAVAELERSLAFWRRVGATAYLRVCQTMLPAAESA
jgi:class 3 adenylate cyclase/TolA-binding protein